MPLDQLYLARPLPSLSNYRSPVKGLYLCGSGSHPGLLFTNTAAWWRHKDDKRCYFNPTKCCFSVRWWCDGRTRLERGTGRHGRPETSMKYLVMSCDWSRLLFTIYTLTTTFILLDFPVVFIKSKTKKKKTPKNWDSCVVMLMQAWHHGADFLWMNKLKQTEMKCLEKSYISILSYFIAAQLAPWSWWETGRWGQSSDPSWRTLPSSCRRLWHQLLQQQAEGGIRKYFRSFHPTVDYATKHAQSKWTIKMSNINIAQYHTQYLYWNTFICAIAWPPLHFAWLPW